MNFLAVEEGKNTHPRYIWSLIFIFIVGNILALIFYIGASFGILAYDETLIDNEGNILNGILSLYLDLFITIFTILGCYLAAKWILKRKFLTLITPNKQINWKRIFYGFSIFFVLLAILSFADLFIHPDDYEFNVTNWGEYALLVLACIILVPIQTTSEELLFRGVLLQWLAKFTKNPLILALIIGAIFGGLHFFNPEMSYGWVLGLDYIFTGFILTYITAKTNSLEYAIGAHAANNMFICLFFTMEHNVMGDIPSMFMQFEFNVYITVLTSIIIQSIFAYIILKKHNKEIDADTGMIIS